MFHNLPGNHTNCEREDSSWSVFHYIFSGAIVCSLDKSELVWLPPSRRLPMVGPMPSITFPSFLLLWIDDPFVSVVSHIQNKVFWVLHREVLGSTSCLLGGVWKPASLVTPDSFDFCDCLWYTIVSARVRFRFDFAGFNIYTRLLTYCWHEHMSLNLLNCCMDTASLNGRWGGSLW